MEINDKIMEIKGKLRTLAKLQLKLDEVNKSLKQEKRKLLDLEGILQKENLDVEKLEKVSITGLFYTILGNKDKQLEKEKQEALSAKLKYDECKNSISVLDREKNELSSSILALGNVEAEYQKVMQEKKEIILASKDERTEKLMNLTEKLSDLKSDKKELDEAIDVGNSLHQSLQRALEALKKAQNWGTWDMLGGGMIATAAKHSNIDDAKVYAHEAQSLLRRFQIELKDVNISADIDINISSFNKFADYFFDGLISDWIVQSKINNSLEEVSNMNFKVKDILNLLTTRRKQVDKKINETHDTIRLLVETA